MKVIKELKLWILVVIIGFLSCNPNDDNMVDPVDDRDKFFGSWTVSESCFKANYTVTISADPGNSAQVLLANFGNPGPNYSAAIGLVAGSKIYVTNQVIGDGWTINGTGNLQGSNRIAWTYTLVIAGNSLNCSSEFIK